MHRKCDSYSLRNPNFVQEKDEKSDNFQVNYFFKNRLS